MKIWIVERRGRYLGKLRDTGESVYEKEFAVYRKLSALISDHNLKGLYSWRSRNKNPDEFEYGGLEIKKHEI